MCVQSWKKDNILCLRELPFCAASHSVGKSKKGEVKLNHITSPFPGRRDDSARAQL